MGFFDSIFGKNEERNIPVVQTRGEKSVPILQEVEDAQQTLQYLQNKAEVAERRLAEIEERYREETAKKSSELSELERIIAEKIASIIELDEKILLQDFSLYKPLYDFVNVEEYKNRLENIRNEQKEMIKDGVAVLGGENWTVNGSVSKGRKMVNDTKKLLLRAFNGECEFVTWKVKYNNFESCKKRIETAYNAIQKLGVTMSIEISPAYFNLKIEELHLALEYQQAKQREQERRRELREQQREEAALQKEIDEARRKVEKEQAHYFKALSNAKKQLENSVNEEDKEVLTQKISELENQLQEIEKSISDIDYRAANQRAGYVYVISNIGSFGENVYKIGMTRRLEPMERIDELGGASVPFNFDVHALIFSDDAPKLEAALHHAFEKKKLNLINTRREFFSVTLDEIKEVIRANYDKSVEFIDTADAEQFRESQKIRVTEDLGKK